MMKITPVITTINHPTKSICKLASSDCLSEVIAIGDLKTPNNFSCPGVRYISVEEQNRLPYQLAKNLPYNHYCRKMLGYLIAAKEHSTHIYDTDDDNYPDSVITGKSLDLKRYKTLNDLGFVNIYGYFCNSKSWPRGFPLELLNRSLPSLEEVTSQHDIVIIQGLVRGDADVDAIYRLVIGDQISFKSGKEIVLGKGSICPINSQNTIFSAWAYPLLYLPTTVTFRYTDILRGLIAQPIAWLYNKSVSFTSPTATQERNPHELMADFFDEVPMHSSSKQIASLVAPSISPMKTIYENLYSAYEVLLSNGIIDKGEMPRLEAWINDLSSLECNEAGHP